RSKRFDGTPRQRRRDRAMPNALIVGASRGIGLEFVRQYVEAGWNVFGTHRSEDDRVRLRDLGAHTLRLDVLEPNDVAGIAWQLDGERLDVAVVNAGVYGRSEERRVGKEGRCGWPAGDQRRNNV